MELAWKCIECMFINIDGYVIKSQFFYYRIDHILYLILAIYTHFVYKFIYITKAEYYLSLFQKHCDFCSYISMKGWSARLLLIPWYTWLALHG